jgi:hypothetical protein
VLLSAEARRRMKQYLGAFADKVQPRGSPERARHEAKMAEERKLAESNERYRKREEAASGLRAQLLLEAGVLHDLAAKPECGTLPGLLELGHQYGIDHYVFEAMKRARLVHEHNGMYSLVWSKRVTGQPKEEVSG